MSEALEEFNSTRKCAQCGKLMTILWPHQWAYKRGNRGKYRYYCSWSCLRANDKEKGETHVGVPSKITKEQCQEAVQLALKGGDPIRFLEKCGSGNCTWKWYDIRQKLKAEDPETYARLPDRIPRKDSRKKPEAPETGTLADAMNGMKNAVETFLGPIETPEKPKVQPDVTVSAIRHKKFGEFYRDFDHNCIDWRTPEGEEVSMSIDGVKELHGQFPELMKQLGVEL